MRPSIPSSADGPARIPSSVMPPFKGEYHRTSSIPSNYMRSQLYLQSWFEKWKNE